MLGFLISNWASIFLYIGKILVQRSCEMRCKRVNMDSTVCSSLLFPGHLPLFLIQILSMTEAALDLRAHMYHMNTACRVNEPFWTWAHHLSLAAGVTCFPISTVTDRQEISMCLSATPSPIVSIEVSVMLQTTCLLLLKPESNPLRVQETCKSCLMQSTMWWNSFAVKNSSTGLHCSLRTSCLLPLAWFWWKGGETSDFSNIVCQRWRGKKGQRH